MKKILLVITLLLLFPSVVLAKDTCNNDDIKIEEITILEKEGYTEELTPVSIDNNKINLNIEMYNVGESITYKIKVKNNSNNNYYFTKDSFNLNTDYIEYSIVNDSEVIKSNEEKSIQLKITYKEKISEDEFNENNMMSITLSDTPLTNPSTKRTINLILLVTFVTTIIFIIRNKKLSKVLIGILICFIPISIKALCTVNLEITANIAINEKEATFLPGPEVNVKMKELAGDDTSTATPSPYYFENENILFIKHSEIEPTNINKEEKNIVSIDDSPYPIYMWYEEGTIYWWSEDKTPNLNEDSSHMFRSMTKLNNIEGLRSFNSSNVLNMRRMFNNINVQTLDDLSSWNTSSVVDMSGVFSGDASLTTLEGLENWDTTNVTDMSLLLYNDKSLISIKELENWNTSNVTDFSYAFYNSPIISLSGLENWDTSKVTNMSYMFMNNESLKSLEELENWDVSNAINIQNMFFGNSQIISVESLSKWNTSNVTNMFRVFSGCTSLKNLNGLENWDVSSVTTFKYMFYGTQNLTNASSVNNWNISSDATFTGMFRESPYHPEFSKVPGTWSNGTFTPTP